MFSKELPGQISGYFGEIGGSYVQSENRANEELAIRYSVGLLLGRNWAVGMKIQNIFYKDLQRGPECMNIWGPFGRWGLRSERIYLYWELGINRGNYSVLGGNIHKENGLMYISYGPALEARIVEGICFEFGITVQEIINRPSPQDGFSSYVAGLVFDLKSGK